LVRCCCGCPVGLPPAGAHSSVSSTRCPPITQHSPAHCQAVSPSSVCRAPLFDYGDFSPKFTSLSCNWLRWR
jgi:hypothetical protein